MADAVIIATQDADHVAPAIAAAEKGYDILLEKPMATTEQGCREIVAAVKRSGVMLGVCHVLRYTPYFRKMREIVQSGVLGQVVSFRHLEQVQFWHQAHSYVRGNWRKESAASPMILAKSSHDLDILLFILGIPCKRLSSFGGLSHFNSAHKPTGAADRCIDCQVLDCPYSASRFYESRLAQGLTGWPVNVITQDLTEAGVRKALSEGPYGLCVYSTDNDVVDHQTINFEFEGGVSGTFTMTAFTIEGGRRTDVYGSHGELRGDGSTIEIFRFSDGSRQSYDFSGLKDGADSGHMGGDFGIMRDFVHAVRTREGIASSVETSLSSHIMAFAAERSRRNGTVEEIRL
jgi:predicted dehydrogenase